MSMSWFNLASKSTVFAVYVQPRFSSTEAKLCTSAAASLCKIGAIVLGSILALKTAERLKAWLSGEKKTSLISLATRAGIAVLVLDCARLASNIERFANGDAPNGTSQAFVQALLNRTYCLRSLDLVALAILQRPVK